MYENKQYLKQTLDFLYGHNLAFIDIGAQSTAPKNTDLGEKVERENLQYFLDLFEQLPKDRRNFFKISLDTFRPSICFWFYDQLQKINHKNTFIWNDVSGVWDQSVEDYLKLNRVKYVFCHNLCPTREQTCDHLNYIDPNLGINDLVTFFEKAAGYSNIILDPCFGFSKTYDQNLLIFNNLDILFASFKNDFFIGISRKKFLQELADNYLAKEFPNSNINKACLVELYQMKYLKKLQSQKNNLSFRLHDPQFYINFMV